MFRYRALSLCALTAACGGATPGQAVKPSAYTAHQALDEQKLDCSTVSEYARPLAVDLPPEERTVLEANMRAGVALVHYDCKQLKVLPDCTVKGSYGYVGVTSKQEVVALRDRNELAVNLPLTGLQLAGQLKSELAAGASLDLAMMMVGMRRTDTPSIASAGLDSGCRDATHFVRGVFVGAFAMSTSERGQAKAAAQIFGAGAAASSESSHLAKHRDGDPRACGRAKLTDNSPPDQCSAVLRLELRALGSSDGETKGGVQINEGTCPKGYILAESGACVDETKQKDERFLCKYGDVVACTQQCDKGHGGSCNNLGVMATRGDGVQKDPKRAENLFEKACAAGEPNGCVNRAQMYDEGYTEEDAALATDLYRRACEAGSMLGCYQYGLVVMGSEKEDERARGEKLIERACKGGHRTACTANSSDAQRAAIFAEACERGELNGCDAAAYLAVSRKNPEGAERYWTKACDGGWLSSCHHLAFAYAWGDNGFPKKPGPARKALHRACDGGRQDACTDFERLEAWLLGPACEAGDDRACRQLADYCRSSQVSKDYNPMAEIGCGLIQEACRNTNRKVICKLADATFPG
ncbi:MAG: tetratricopeptide repeat protein [Polyangiaceae bacterium]